jgi:rare lipoprotein A
MKRINVALLAGLVLAVLCIPRAEAQNAGGGVFRQEGIASWYGGEFDGRPTASGEIFDSGRFTAAHPSLPFGTILTITNKQNNRKVSVRVNDRGPFVSARIIDVSKAAAEQLDMIVTGTAPVLIESTGVSVAGALQPVPARSAAPVQSEVQQPVAAPAVQTPAAPAQTPAVPPVQTPPAPAVAVPVNAVQPASVQAVYYGPARLTPEVSPEQNKVYRLQVGSYRIPKNAVDMFEKLKNAGFNPAYERNGEFFRVVLAGIRAEEVQPTADRLGAAGVREALIREER